MYGADTERRIADFSPRFHLGSQNLGFVELSLRGKQPVGASAVASVCWQVADRATATLRALAAPPVPLSFLRTCALSAASRNNSPVPRAQPWFGLITNTFASAAWSGFDGGTALCRFAHAASCR